MTQAQPVCSLLVRFMCHAVVAGSAMRVMASPPPPQPYPCENKIMSQQQEALFPQLLEFYRCSCRERGGM